MKNVEHLVVAGLPRGLEGASRVSPSECPLPTDRELARYLAKRRWFAGKARALSGASIVETLPLPGSSTRLTLARVRYGDGSDETYFLPLALGTGDRAGAIERAAPESIVARPPSAVLYDAAFDPSFGPLLLDAIARRRRLEGGEGAAFGSTTSALPRLWRGSVSSPCRLIGGEQTNTSMRIGERVLLKLIRRVEDGVNPELEIGRFLAGRSSRARVPALAGALEYHEEGREPATLAIVHAFTRSRGDAWTHTLGEFRRFLEKAHGGLSPTPPPSDVLALLGRKPSHEVREAMGGGIDSARLLGRRTAELHRALGGRTRDTRFTPEPFTLAYQRSLETSLRDLTVRVLAQLRERLPGLPRSVAADAARLLSHEQDLLGRFEALSRRKLSGRRIRCHGDLHLGQVLETGGDFTIIDFEGEPDRPLAERRVKHSPLRDVAGMLRSFHYAARTGLSESPDPRGLDPAARLWYLWSAASFLEGYLDAVAASKFLPTDPGELALLLDILILEKAIYETGYELNRRPAWLAIPVQGILEILEK